jgi:UDPglucose 6-dehydrogenase
MHLFLVGAGHVGLVTAVGMARLGHRVTVADIDGERIAGLRQGRAPIFEPGLEDGIRAAVDRLAFTTDLKPPADARFSLVAVGTPLGPDGPLDTGYVADAVGRLLDQTGPDHVIVIRSTLPMSGPAALIALRGGRPDTPAIVTNPEFMREGSALSDFERPGRVVTGWLEERDREAANAALQLYKGIDAPTLVADARSVALIKLASNVFLAMKIAYANELARLSDAFGADAAVVADGLGMDGRIGRSFLTAGPGFGGSCLPEQAVALAAIAGESAVPAPLIDSIARSNRVHQQAIVERVAELLGAGAGSGPGSGPGSDAGSGARSSADSILAGRNVALFGLAFKADTDDIRESPALALASGLRAAGASVVGTDPRAGAKAARADPLLAVRPTPEEAAAGADAVVVVTEWPEYGDLDWAAIAAAMRGDLVFDSRRVVDPVAVRAAGLRLVALGRPGGLPG